VPDSFGKRNREKVKAKKAEARDDRRIARNRRRKGLPPATVSALDFTDQVVPAGSDEVPADNTETA
jgi:hypothetical protein